eukprot:1179081-Prorocentrum_minimum.AAC.1
MELMSCRRNSMSSLTVGRSGTVERYTHGSRYAGYSGLSWYSDLRARFGYPIRPVLTSAPGTAPSPAKPTTQQCPYSGPHSCAANF